MRTAPEVIFYNVPVTSNEMWQAVGKLLKQTRLDRDWLPITVQREGGPTYKTVQAIERGEVGNVDKLDQYARVLHVSIVDVLYQVLTAETTALTPEAAQIVRKFSQTTVEGRTALLAIVNALPVAPPPPRLPVAAATPVERDRSPLGPRAAKRRKGR